jgi:UDP-N-acetyl-D-mannosaminuronic acid dehydrogenase
VADLNRKNPKILIIGLGQIGYHNAEYMTQLGINVEGYDSSREAVQRALRARIIRKEAKTFSDYDFYLICVSTHNPKNMFQPYFDGLLDTAKRISMEGKDNSLVAIESTVTLGICDQVYDILRHRFHVAHIPHRFYIKDKQEHGVRQLRVLGGCRKCCIDEALYFYRDVLRIPIHRVKSVDIAALSKVIENAYRFLEISFVEELKLFCNASDLDYKELHDAINSKWNIKLLEAQGGIGGHCLPKDSRMYLDLSKYALPQSVMKAAVEVDEIYKEVFAGESQVNFEVIVPDELVLARGNKKSLFE